MFLIDKDPDVIEIITILLTEEGYVPVIAEKPFSLSQVRAASPVLVLLHSGLDNQGLDICRQLKADPQLSSIPVLLSSTLPNLPELARACGADCYIAKPFDIDEFCALVNSCLRDAQISD